MKQRTTVLFLAAALASPVFAADAWVKRSAELRTDASAAASTVLRLDKGDRVNVVETQGAWSRIEFKGQSGWVSADTLSTREVKPEVKLSGPLGTDARASSGAAAKGLQPLTNDYAKRQGISTKGVDEMEDIKKSITPEMLKQFVADGNISPPRRGRKGRATTGPAAASARDERPDGES